MGAKDFDSLARYFHLTTPQSRANSPPILAGEKGELLPQSTSPQDGSRSQKPWTSTIMKRPLVLITLAWLCVVLLLSSCSKHGYLAKLRKPHNVDTPKNQVALPPLKSPSDPTYKKTLVLASFKEQDCSWTSEMPSEYVYPSLTMTATPRCCLELLC